MSNRLHKRTKYGAKAAYRCLACDADPGPQEKRRPLKRRTCMACGEAGHIHHFDSAIEARRWDVLRQRERLGLIRELRPHPKYLLELNGVQIGTYEADSVYYQDGLIVAEDVKGVDTEVSQIKRALVKAIYSVDVRVVRRAGE